MIHFGTDGLRGKFNDELLLEHALKLGEFLGYKAQGKTILVAEDTRISSPLLAQALTLGIISMGSNVECLDVLPTPGLAYLLSQGDYAYGVMISASHNLYFDNGLKVFSAKGGKISQDMEKEIETYLHGSKTLERVDSVDLGNVIYTQRHEEYLTHLIESVKHRFDGLKIVLDMANGATSQLAAILFESLGAQVIAMYQEPNGLNINRFCGSTEPKLLREKVLSEKADIGFAFDGDGDRCMAVDRHGKLIDGDGLIYVLARFLKDQNKLHNDGISVTVMANLGFIKSCEKMGLAVHLTDVGDRHVAASMEKNEFSLGGEQSGHIILQDYATTGDGMLTAIKVTEAIVYYGKDLDQILKECVKYPQTLEKVVVDDKHSVMENPVLLKEYEKIQNRLEGEGRILVRASGTESVIRVMVESPDMKLCETLSSDMIKVINNIQNG